MTLDEAREKAIDKAIEADKAVNEAIKAVETYEAIKADAEAYKTYTKTLAEALRSSK